MKEILVDKKKLSFDVCAHRFWALFYLIPGTTYLIIILISNNWIFSLFSTTIIFLIFLILFGCF